MFGPHGTGKIMLTKAISIDVEENFINISMGIVASNGLVKHWLVFTLPNKISPIVVFIDEVDNMRGQRGKHSEHSPIQW